MERRKSDISEHCRLLREGISDIWDAEDWMGEEYVFDLPPGKFVAAIHKTDPDVLSWLVFFVARRALPCWDYCFDDDRARQRVLALGKFLLFGEVPDWADIETAIKSPFLDCRQSDTQSASNSAAEAARYVHRQDPAQALYCISSADCAYDHVLTEDCFREWLVEVATPIAFEKREMTADEMECMRRSAFVEPLIIQGEPDKA